MVNAIDETFLLETKLPPPISPQTKKFLNELSIPLSDSIGNLKERIENFREINKRIKADDFNAIALLSTVFVIGILAAGVFGTYFCISAGSTFGAVSTGFGTIYILTAVAAFYNRQFTNENGKALIPLLDKLHPFFVMFLGPFVPLWMAGPFIPVIQTKGLKNRLKITKVEEISLISKYLNQLKNFDPIDLSELKEDLKQLKSAYSIVKLPEVDMCLKRLDHIEGELADFIDWIDEYIHKQSEEIFD